MTTTEELEQDRYHDWEEDFTYGTSGGSHAPKLRSKAEIEPWVAHIEHLYAKPRKEFKP